MTMLRRMPVVFAGHGSPMNAIEENDWTRGMERIGKTLPKPKAILAVSAHWTTGGSRVGGQEQPKQIYDMGGFPSELYAFEYRPKGSPELAARVLELLGDLGIRDDSWGIDHGTWSVLCRMVPEADVPVVQLSVDVSRDGVHAFEVGRLLAPLREEGILILGSGNVVHNLWEIAWDMEGRGFPWADEFDLLIRDRILEGDYRAVAEVRRDPGSPAARSVPTPEHFLPLLTILGAAGKGEPVEVFNEGRTYGSLSMTGYRIG